MELDHGLGCQVTRRQHLQGLHQLHHGIVVLMGHTEPVTSGFSSLLLFLLELCSYLYISVGKQQVHHDVLREDLCVVDSEFNAGKLLGQLLSLIFLSGLSDVVQQGVLKRGAAGDRRSDRKE